MLRSAGFVIVENPEREVYLCRRGQRHYAVERPIWAEATSSVAASTGRDEAMKSNESKPGAWRSDQIRQPEVTPPKEA